MRELANYVGRGFPFMNFPLFGNFRSFFEDEFPYKVKSTEKGYTLELAVPGFNQTDLNVCLKEGMLEVVANHEDEEGNKKHMEYRFGLPSDVNSSSEEFEARCKDGILYLNVPRKEEAQPKRIEVKDE